MKHQKIPHIEITSEIPHETAREGLVFYVFADEPRLSLAAGERLTRWRERVESLLTTEAFEGETDEILSLHVAAAAADDGEGAGGAETPATEQLRPRHLFFVGAGRHDDLDTAALRRAAGAAVREARPCNLRRLTFVLPATRKMSAAEVVAACVEGAIFGAYDNDFYQQADEEKIEIETLSLVGEAATDELKAAIERARIVGEAVNWARALSDEPGLALPPREFARRAAEMAAEFGLAVESLSAEEIRARGLGALWGVGQGSEEEPALIVVRYEPEGASPDDELWAFVGKGITFDTGGISIKHGLDMFEMKADMAGGAAALGALRAIAQLKPERRVVAVVPAAENMPSGRSLKPGDIVRTFAGYTIEVVDTDAEGRLVLSDGLAYARHLGATHIVDLATLTGSIIIALGDYRTGLFSNHDEWAERVRVASERAGEPTWRMPVGDDYKKLIESAIADFKNYGGRPDATSAALLLSKFAADTPWVHLDIAGASWYDDAQPHAPQGSTGTGVRTLVELVLSTDAS